MSRRLRIILAIVAVIVVLGVAGGFFLRSRGAGPEIETATVERSTLAVNVNASGQISAGASQDLYPPTQGTLSDVYVVDGAAVKAGENIAQMDTAPLELVVEQAKSGLKQAQAQLSAAKQQTPSQADINAASASVTAAKAGLDAAKVAEEGAQKAYDAAKRAYETSPTPVSAAAVNQAEVQLAQASAGVDQANAAYLGAKAQYSKVKSTSTGAAQAAAQAGVSQAQDALALAEANLENATFVAPFDGTVIFNPVGQPTSATSPAPKATEGSAVTPAAAPFTVVDLDASEFTAQVDETDIGRVKVEMNSRVTLDAFPGTDFSGKVTKIGKAAQLTQTGGTVFPVQLMISNNNEDLLLGMKGDASVEVSAVPDAVVIPVETLFNENGQNFVYVVENDVLNRVDITIGATTDTQVQVLEGLKPGGVVAKSGPVQYSDGLRVRTQ